jgi:DNA repair protein RecN (Recombination protein N)
MLTDLIIENFAIIDRLHVTFGSGFNVLTGETGAGKSIIIDAVGLILGDRARPDIIRTGEESASVEAVLDIVDIPGVREELAEAGFDTGEELLVRRIVSRSGRNRIYLNGSLATLGQLQQIASRLIVIYGQHEHQSLQRTGTHLELLDRFGSLRAELQVYRGHYREVVDLTGRLADLEQAELERQQRLDLLRFQSREITEADLRPGEDEELAAERLLLQNAERLAAATRGGYQSLYGAEGAVTERLDAAAGDLESLSGIDPELGRLAETIRGSLYAIEDVAAQLRDYADRIAFEPGRQQEVEERLALLTRLKRKYGPDIEAIIAHRTEIDREIDELDDLDSARARLRKALVEAQGKLEETGETLSLGRRKAATALRQMVEGELRDLAMGNARFEMRLTALADPGPRGLEEGTFYLAPNPGEAAKPLARIASGGELSRLMLAIKRAAPESDGMATLIFDEVDAGVGGEAATAVGEKLKEVAGRSQVLCVTHLPQVAAFADRHYRVEKARQGERTRTQLVCLDDESRVREMARMLGGSRVTEATLEHAREMISQPGGIS